MHFCNKSVTKLLPKVCKPFSAYGSKLHTKIIKNKLNNLNNLNWTGQLRITGYLFSLWFYECHAKLVTYDTLHVSI